MYVILTSEGQRSNDWASQAAAAAVDQTGTSSLAGGRRCQRWSIRFKLGGATEGRGVQVQSEACHFTGGGAQAPHLAEPDGSPPLQEPLSS